MAFRTFVDSEGNEWQAYDVVPRPDERRHYDRRSGEEEVEKNRRNSDDRRLTVGKLSVNTSVKQGWLCFERGGDRRRLSPIPKDWQRCTDEELNAYRETARPVRASTAVMPPSDE